MQDVHRVAWVSAWAIWAFVGPLSFFYWLRLRASTRKNARKPPLQAACLPEQQRQQPQAVSVPVQLPSLSPAEEASVLRGTLVTKPYVSGLKAGTGIAVQLVRSPPSTVWRTLLAFREYPRMVTDVQSATVYSEDATKGIGVAIRVGYGLIGLTTCLRHVYDEALSQLTWSLDEERKSSFRSNSGFWVVKDGPAPGSSIVFYSCTVELDGFVPSWLNNFVAQQGIPRAVAWVKREAEDAAVGLRSPSLEKGHHARALGVTIGSQDGQLVAKPAMPFASCLLSWLGCRGCFGLDS
jgi:hypothetical protein